MTCFCRCLCLWHEAYATFKEQLFFKNVEMHLFLFSIFLYSTSDIGWFFYFFLFLSPTGENVPVILNKEKENFSLFWGAQKNENLVK